MILIINVIESAVVTSVFQVREVTIRK